MAKQHDSQSNLPPLMMNTEKERLRAQAKAARQKISSGERRALAQHLDELPLVDVFGPSQTIIAAFLPISDEPDLMPFITKLQDAGYITCLPVVNKLDEPLVFREFSVGDPLEQGSFHTMHPEKDRRTLEPQVLLVPFLAFDHYGHRLGWGGGYYDRSLGLLKSQKAIKAIGVGFSCQEVKKLPYNQFDVVLDAVISDKGMKLFH